jgi:O-antigen/teichoic acid export membrane protein
MNIQKLLYQNIIWRGLFYLLTFILNVAIARHFEAELTGYLYYLINIYAFITLLASASLESGIVYFASSKKIHPPGLFNFSIVWIVCVASVMVLLFLSITYFSEIKIQTNEFLYALFFVCGNLLVTFLNSLLYADNKFRLANITGIVINGLLIALLFFVTGNYWLTNEKYIFIYFGSFLLQGISLSIIFITNVKQEYKFRLPPITEIKWVFKYCLLAFASNLVTFLYYRVDYWFVHHYLPPDELGNYIQVSKIAQMFFVLPAILAAAVFPLTAGGRRQEVNDILMIVSRSILFLYSIVCFLLAVTGKWLFPFIFGDSFSKMYVPFLFLIPGILGLSTLFTLTAYYAGKNRVMVNLKGALLTLFIIVSGDAFFIPVYGINAAAAVSSVGYIIYHIYVLSIFTKEYKTPVLGFFYFKFSDLQRMKQSILKNTRIV